MGLNIGKMVDNNKSSGANIFQEGANYIRVLPRSMQYFVEDDDDFVYKYKVHYINVLGEDRVRTVVCPTNENKPCPLCMMSKALYLSSLPDDKSLASKLYARYKYLINIALLEADNMGNVDMNRSWNVTAATFTQKTVYQGIFQYLINPKWPNLLDPIDGRNFCVTVTPSSRTESGYNEYSVSPDPTVTKIKLVKGWKKQLDTLKDNMPEIASYEELYNLIIDAGYYDRIEDMPKVMQSLFSRELDMSPSEAPKPVEPISNPVDDTPDVPDTDFTPDEEPIKADDGKPDCFGIEFGPRKAKCSKCSVKGDCLNVFMNDD